MSDCLMAKSPLGMTTLTAGIVAGLKWKISARGSCLGGLPCRRKHRKIARKVGVSVESVSENAFTKETAVAWKLVEGVSVDDKSLGSYGGTDPMAEGGPHTRAVIVKKL